MRKVPEWLRGECAIAAILDSYGGVRVVVSLQDRLKHHVRFDELCVTVPDMHICSRVPHGAMAGVVRVAHESLDRWIETRNDTDYDGFREHVVMWQLRKLEQGQQSLHLPDICFT